MSLQYLLHHIKYGPVLSYRCPFCNIEWDLEDKPKQDKLKHHLSTCYTVVKMQENSCTSKYRMCALGHVVHIHSLKHHHLCSVIETANLSSDLKKIASEYYLFPYATTGFGQNNFQNIIKDTAAAYFDTTSSIDSAFEELSDFTENVKIWLVEEIRMKLSNYQGPHLACNFADIFESADPRLISPNKLKNESDEDYSLRMEALKWLNIQPTDLTRKTVLKKVSRPTTTELRNSYMKQVASLRRMQFKNEVVKYEYNTKVQLFNLAMEGRTRKRRAEEEERQNKVPKPTTTTPATTTTSTTTPATTTTSTTTPATTTTSATPTTATATTSAPAPSTSTPTPTVKSTKCNVTTSPLTIAKSLTPTSSKVTGITVPSCLGSNNVIDSHPVVADMPKVQVPSYPEKDNSVKNQVKSEPAIPTNVEGKSKRPPSKYIKPPGYTHVDIEDLDPKVKIGIQAALVMMGYKETNLPTVPKMPKLDLDEPPMTMQALFHFKEEFQIGMRFLLDAFLQAKTLQPAQHTHPYGMVNCKFEKVIENLLPDGPPTMEFGHMPTIDQTASLTQKQLNNDELRKQSAPLSQKEAAMTISEMRNYLHSEFHQGTLKQVDNNNFVLFFREQSYMLKCSSDQRCRLSLQGVSPAKPSRHSVDPVPWIFDTYLPNLYVPIFVAKCKKTNLLELFSKDELCRIGPTHKLLYTKEHLIMEYLKDFFTFRDVSQYINFIEVPFAFVLKMQRIQVRTLGRAFYQQDHQLPRSFRDLPGTMQNDYLAGPFSDVNVRIKTGVCMPQFVSKNLESYRITDLSKL